jgi:hypothetical protein
MIRIDFCFIQQTIITLPNKDSKLEFSLELITTSEQIQDLINEFEPNIELKKKGQLSLNGLSRTAY